MNQLNDSPLNEDQVIIINKKLGEDINIVESPIENEIVGAALLFTGLPQRQQLIRTISQTKILTNVTCNLEVEVKEAKNLIQIEDGFKGDADPFVTVTVCGLSKSTPVWNIKQNGNPKWNTKLKFVPFQIQNAKDFFLYIKVQDLDELLNSKTFMGDAKVELELKNGEFEKWINLENVNSGELKILVRVKLERNIVEKIT